MNPEAENIELVLRDIHLPDNLLWWPLAPGWWIVISMLLLLALSIYIYKKTYYRRKLKKNVRLELTEFHLNYTKTGDAVIFIQQLSAFLRRMALERYQDENIANLHGIEWLDFLDSKLPSQKLNPSKSNPEKADFKTQFTFKNGVGKIFLTGPYQMQLAQDLMPVYKLVENWLNYNFKNKYGLL